MLNNCLQHLDNIGAEYAQQDQLLLNGAFIGSKLYSSITHDETFLLLGTKGSGKTALARMLETSHKLNGDTMITIVDFDNLNASALTDTSLEEHKRRPITQQKWKIILLLRILKSIHKQRNYKYDEKSKKKLLEKIVKVFDEVGPDINSIFSWPGIRKLIDGLSRIEIAEFGVRFRERTYEEELRWLSNIVTSLSASIIRTLNKDVKHVIFIDEFDDLAGYKGASKETVLESLEELIKACDSLHNSTFRFIDELDSDSLAPQANWICKVVLEIRSDIYEELRHQSKPRLEGKNVARLAWYENSGELNLKELFLHRMSKACNIELREMTLEKAFLYVNSFDYILDRSLRRPRNVICYVNYAINRHKEHLKQETVRAIAHSSVLMAEDEYSNYLLQELQNEINIGTADVDLFQPIKLIGERVFTFDEFKDAVNQIHVCNDNDVRNMLEKLFSSSAIGIQRVGGAKGGTTEIWRYKERNAPFGKATRYMVHRGLYRACGITS